MVDRDREEIERLRARVAELEDELSVAGKAAEAALRLSDERLQRSKAELEAIFEGLPAPLCIAFDPECRVIAGNRAAQELLGIVGWMNISASPAEGNLIPPYRVFRQGQPVPPEDMPMQRAAREQREVQVGILQVIHADGSSRHFSGNAVPLFDEKGAISGSVGAFLDVTDSVLAEEALRRKNRDLERMNTELEEFAYAASHDLKAPLRAVAHLTDWLLEDLEERLDAENLQRLRLLHTRVLRMDRLINGLLAYARLGYESPPAPVRVPLAPLLRELVAEIALPAGFRVEICEPLPALVADPLHLRQIFQNLIENAAKHHDSPSGVVSVRAVVGTDHWRIEVADDGPGIPAECRHQIFKMFATLKRRDETENTGIGLALVRKLVIRYGGAIDIAPNQPRGALFTILWPADGSHPP